MPWNDVDSSKGTLKQIEYAEHLLEELYGDINLPIYTMTKHELSKLISQCLEDLGR